MLSTTDVHDRFENSTFLNVLRVHELGKCTDNALMMQRFYRVYTICPLVYPSCTFRHGIMYRRTVLFRPLKDTPHTFHTEVYITARERSRHAAAECTFPDLNFPDQPS